MHTVSAHSVCTSIEIISGAEGVIPSEGAELLSVTLLLLLHGGPEVKICLPDLHRGPTCCSIT